jgi:hypothetical protein
VKKRKKEREKGKERKKERERERVRHLIDGLHQQYDRKFLRILKFSKFL